MLLRYLLFASTTTCLSGLLSKVHEFPLSICTLHHKCTTPRFSIEMAKIDTSTNAKDFNPIFTEKDITKSSIGSGILHSATDTGLFGLSDEWVARLVLVTVSAFYGTNFGCVKILNDALSPSLAAALRFSLAALVFLPNLLRTFPKNPNLMKGGVEVGVYSFLGYWAQATALQTTSASKGMDSKGTNISLANFLILPFL